jgi:hypothetical protein
MASAGCLPCAVQAYEGLPEGALFKPP